LFDSSERESFSSTDRVPDPNKGTDPVAGLLIFRFFLLNFIVGFDVLRLKVGHLDDVIWLVSLLIFLKMDLFLNGLANGF